MGDHDTGDPKCVVEQTNQPDQHAHGDRVLADERLVVHENLRIERNRPGQRDTTLHATGQFIRHQLDSAAQTDRLQFEQDDVADHFFR
jgi:hypothetical protein